MAADKTMCVRRFGGFGLNGAAAVSGETEPVGTLQVALAHAERLLARDPALAARQATEILRVLPGERGGLMLLARAQAAMGDPAAGATTLGELTRRAPGDAEAWRVMADLLNLAGDETAADQAHLSALQASVTDPELVQAARALRHDQLGAAEHILRTRLKANPTDIAAIRMFAEVAARLGRTQDAVNLLERCLELSPGFHEARRAYALLLQRQERNTEALIEADRLLALDLLDPGYGMLKAAILARLGDAAGTIPIYEQVLNRLPRHAMGWMSLGHSLKTVGRTADGIEAYRRALSLAPNLGEVWWSLANLKTYRFTDEDEVGMRAQLERSDLAVNDRFHLNFALAKAREDRGDFGAAFEQYAEGAAVRRMQLRYSPDNMASRVRRAAAVFDQAFFERRRATGCTAPDPIFIVGLPRAGSTLIEQILSSHSQVEGTMELPDLPAIVERLANRKGADGQLVDYPVMLADLSNDELRELGEGYLESTRIRRKTGRPLFIDKLPNNWINVGLIQLILPNATIIDARRHPMGGCFSAFKQHFARGQGFTYGLEDIGRYYRDYVALMAHFDAVLPGRVHRVIYERMVSDTEGEVRRLLKHAGLPFEEACLSFWSNDRAVRTPSSEQVRQPIFADAVEHWRNFEPWLDPLKAALGPVLSAYPEAPTDPML